MVAALELSVLSHDPLAPTVFHERWWLDVTSGGRWQEVEVRLDHRLVGRLPFLENSYCGLRKIAMPPLTHQLGPAVDEGNGNASTRMARRTRLQRELIEQLPRSGNFRQTLHYASRDAVAFQAAGFATTVQFTYEMAPMSEAALWMAFTCKTRNVIRKWMIDGRLEDWPDPEAFSSFYTANLAAKGVRNSYRDEVILRVCSETLMRGRGRIIAARNANGAFAAAIFVVWDHRALYYLMSTRDPEISNAGTVSALIWEAMRVAAARGILFDFDGIASSGAAKFYAGFGAEVQPRYIVARENALFRFVRGVWRGLHAHETNRFF
jgi:hypothetical protein